MSGWGSTILPARRGLLCGYTLFVLLVAAVLGFGAPAGAADKIDLNRADANTLASIPGIGPKRAQEIIDYRDQNGLIEYWDELLEIPGIGEKMLEKIRDSGSLTGGITQLEPDIEQKEAAKKKSKKAQSEKKQAQPEVEKKNAETSPEKETVPIPGYRYEDIPNWSRM